MGRIFRLGAARPSIRRRAACRIRTPTRPRFFEYVKSLGTIIASQSSRFLLFPLLLFFIALHRAFYFELFLGQF
jgi:hypothetical protein